MRYNGTALSFCACLLLYIVSCAFSSNTLQAQTASSILTKKVLQQIFPAAHTYQVKKMLGGFSSPGIWEVVIDHKAPYVVRFSNPYRSSQDKHLEIQCLKLAADQGFSPKLYYANGDQGLIVLEKISKVQLNANFPVTLALFLKRLHSGKSFPRTFDIFSFIKKCIGFLGTEIPYEASLIIAELPKLQRALKAHELQVPCHNDLNPTNILFNGSNFKFIDWELAGQADPFLDVATLFNFFITTPAEQTDFLKVYWGRSPTSFESAKIYLMQQVSLAFYGLAYLTVAKMAKPVPLHASEKRALASYGTFFSKLPSNLANGNRRLALKQFAINLLDNFLLNVRNLRYKRAIEILQKSAGATYARAS